MVLTVSADKVAVESLFVEDLGEEESAKVILVDHAEL